MTGCIGTLNEEGICETCDEEILEGHWKEGDWCDEDDREEARSEGAYLDRQRHHYGNDDI